MIVHQIEALVAAGVTDIVLAVNYRPEIMEKFLAEVRQNQPLHMQKFWADVRFSMRKSTTSTLSSLSSLSLSTLPDP